MKILKVCYSTDLLPGKQEPVLHDYQDVTLLALTRDEAAHLIALLSKKLARQTFRESDDFLNLYLVHEK